jgi:hypothetical protein
MTLRRLSGASSLYYPALLQSSRTNSSGTAGGFSTLNTAGGIDAAGEKVAFIGHVIWMGGESTKTMGAASKIHFRTSTVTMADAGTTVRIGLQDVATASGPPIQPDGTFDVYVEFAGDAGVIVSADDNIAKSVTLSTSGTKDLANGQLVAVVFDMVARAGTDALNLAAGFSGGTYFHIPICIAHTTSWITPGSSAPTPMVMFEADDGTLGTLLHCGYYAPGGVYTYASSSTPDERALIFQVPFKCSINGISIATGGNSATADGELILYSDPLGTPTAVENISLPGAQMNGGGDERVNYYAFATERTLEPNTDYAIAYRATGAGSVNLGYISMNSAAQREINGMANCRGGSRTDGTGAFESLSDIALPVIAVGICALDDGTGSGRASINLGV